MVHIILTHTLNTKILTYITSDRIGFETQIAQDVIDLFINHLDHIGTVPKISLYLYTRGGDTAVAWNIVNLLRQYTSLPDSFIEILRKSTVIIDTPDLVSEENLFEEK